jgi:signal peptidase
MRILGKIVGFLTIICYLLILMVLIVAAPMVVGYKTVVVLSGSMEPAYPVGSVIYYKHAGFDDISVGDVISYAINDDSRTLVTHRVYAKEDSTKEFVTKGDANATPDSNPMSYSNVKGKVIEYHIPYAGYFVQYVQNYFVIGSIFLILVAKVAFDNLADKKKESDITN